MINRLAKGRRIETLARKWYESRGWRVRKHEWSKWGEKDWWGYADLWCIAKGREPMLVQVRVREEAGHLERDGKMEAARELEGCGFRLVLLLYGGKRRARAPEWEERAMLSDGTWVRTYP